MPPVFGKGLLSRLFKCQSQGMKITYKTPSWGIDLPALRIILPGKENILPFKQKPLTVSILAIQSSHLQSFSHLESSIKFF